eukprot:4135294-Prymnesium_polylepis.1
MRRQKRPTVGPSGAETQQTPAHRAHAACHTRRSAAAPPRGVPSEPVHTLQPSAFCASSHTRLNASSHMIARRAKIATYPRTTLRT